MGSFRYGLSLLLHGRTGLDAGLHLWNLFARLMVAVVLFMAVIAVLLALEPTL